MMVFDQSFFKMRRSVQFNAVACIRLVLGIVSEEKDEASLLVMHTHHLPHRLLAVITVNDGK